MGPRHLLTPPRRVGWQVMKYEGSAPPPPAEAGPRHLTQEARPGSWRDSPGPAPCHLAVGTDGMGPGLWGGGPNSEEPDSSLPQ